MSNPAFIVEGQMEQRIIRRLCPGQPIRRLNCNGDSVAIVRICDFLETQIRTLGNRNYPIIIIFDREKRNESVEQIQDIILCQMKKRGLLEHDIRVFVADREAEDWYLMDVVSIRNHYQLPATVSNLRGKGGLIKLLKPAVDYHETTVGVELFSVVSKKLIAEKCKTFRRLMETVVEIKCAMATGQDLI